MPSVPRITRVLPYGPITRPEAAIPAIAHLRWASGHETDVPAVVVGWTSDAVEINWDYHGVLQDTWLPTCDVHGRKVEPP